MLAHPRPGPSAGAKWLLIRHRPGPSPGAKRSIVLSVHARQLAQSSRSFSPRQVALPLRREGGHTNSGCVARLPSAARTLCRSSAGCFIGPGHVALGEQVATQTPAVSLACPAQPGRSFIPVLVAPLAQGMWLLGPLAGRLICHPGQAALSSQGRLLCCSGLGYRSAGSRLI